MYLYGINYLLTLYYEYVVSRCVEPRVTLGCVTLLCTASHDITLRYITHDMQYDLQ